MRPQLDVSSFFEISNGFALGPFSLLDFIVVFIAVCMTLVIGVVFIGGFGQVNCDDSVLRTRKLPESINNCKDKGTDSYGATK